MNGYTKSRKKKREIEKETEAEKEAEVAEAKNKGKLLIDATCTPADISYPTDLNLLNDGREKREEIIDVLHEPHKGKQKSLYDQRSHKVADKNVSISQPYVRPIVRGKTNADVEFGAKISFTMADGYAFLEKLSLDAFNEAGELKEHIENYHRRFGNYPASVHVDEIYRNRENREYCKSKDIQISVPPLGRPPKDPAKDRRLLKGAKESEIERIPIEGKFGNGKRKYG